MRSCVAVGMVFYLVLPAAQAEPAVSAPDSFAQQAAVYRTLNTQSAARLVSDYYNRNGVWARVFEIEQIDRLRIQRYGKRRALVHAEYRYRPLSRQAGSAGSDRRVFTLIKRTSGHWTVISMGRYMSGRLSR